MNREFRFRIWDNGRKEWIHGPGSEVNLFGETIMFGELFRRPDDTMVSLDDLNNLVALQFSGLHDKSGKEIYEGDVVEWWDSYGVPELGNDSFSTRAVVNFEGGMFQPICGINPNEIEILGNIYSNPELLQEIKKENL
jgi:uncharacterized phage protein (TIGR01671 family)